MSSTVRVEDFDTCCRCCLERAGTMTPIFSGCLNGMFNDLIRLKISQDDGYPQQMCSRCILKLSTLHNFYHMVLNSHKSLEVALTEAASEKASKELLANINIEVVMKNEPTQLITRNKCKEEKLELNIKPSDEPFTLQESCEESSDSEDTYQCPQCDHRSSTQEDLVTHLETHVSRDANSKVFPKPDHLCSYCGKRFRLRTSLAKHVRGHRGNVFQCKYCDKRYAEASALKVHLVSHNLVNPKPFWCSFCGKSFGQKSSLTKHERGHYSPAGHPCGHCQKSFRQAYSLQKHISREHDTVKCDLCSKHFVGKKTLDAHMKTHRPANLSTKRKTIIRQRANKTIEQVDVESVRVEFLCMLCVQKFQSKESLEAHLCSRDNVS